MMMKADRMAFEIPYPDDSGAKLAVRLDKNAAANDCTIGEVEIEAVDTIGIPLHHLGWLRDALDRVWQETRDLRE